MTFGGTGEVKKKRSEKSPFKALFLVKVEIRHCIVGKHSRKVTIYLHKVVFYVNIGLSTPAKIINEVSSFIWIDCVLWVSQ